MKRFIIFFVLIIACAVSGCYVVCHHYARQISPEKALPEEKKISFTTSNAGGYESLLDETSITSLSHQGTIPSWFSGSFLINGPAQFELKKEKFQYWFDGFAMVHCFSCNNGSISYANKFLKSSYYTQALKDGVLPAPIASDKKPSFFSRMKTKVTALVSKRPLYDNTNAHITIIDGNVIALTETPHHIVFDPESLETYGRFTYDDSLDGHVCTAHPLIDHETGELFNVLTTFGTTSTYHVYKVPKKSKSRRDICSLSSSEPSYIHSFSITKHYIILTLVPLVINPLDLLCSTKAFLTHYKWVPKRNTEFVVIDRNKGTIVNTLKTDPFFVFHHVNAYEQNRALVIDLVSHPNSSIIDSAELKHLCTGKSQKNGTLTRFTLDLAKNKVHASILSSINLESPRINDHYCGHRYSYMYAVNASNTALLKINVQKGTSCYWQENNCYPGEPVFVAKPNSRLEDDGVILSCVLDPKQKKSFLLMLDATTFKELARAQVPHHIPCYFHGMFYKAQETSS